MVQFRDLWYGHPINESVTTPCLAPEELKNLEGKPIPVHFPVFGNQCAIRMGVALKRSGVTLSQLRGCATCGVHVPDDMHIINASQLANAIRRANLPGVGPVEIMTGNDAKNFYPKIFGRTGIIYISDYWTRSTDAAGTPTGDH
ncbi:MAG: type VI secretion system amidase effector protein Tae4, partial [Hyphomicrobiaceae bacterium]|nr:type VI secretion system amidase effector protein Tae4 [Hyphomicrobiaceae bacterium]